MFLILSLPLPLSVPLSSCLSPHHYDQMYIWQRSQVSRIAIWRCALKLRVSLFVIVFVVPPLGQAGRMKDTFSHMLFHVSSNRSNHQTAKWQQVWFLESFNANVISTWISNVFECECEWWKWFVVLLLFLRTLVDCGAVAGINEIPGSREQRVIWFGKILRHWFWIFLYQIWVSLFLKIDDDDCHSLFHSF